VLLLYGQKRAAVPPDAQHPLGHGRELYFWSFVVAVLIFALGAGISIYEGIHHLLHPEPIADAGVSFGVYGAAFIFEGVSWAIGFRNFRRAAGGTPFWRAVRESKDPAALIVVFEDSAAIAGILIAAAGTALAIGLGQPAFDGGASIGIGLVLAATAALLARESKGLLIGERADSGTRDLIRNTAERDPGVRKVGDILTVHLSPDQIVAAMVIDFDPDLRTDELERSVAKIETEIKRKDRRVVALFLKPQHIEG
jgi:cation diffusion facilitator family transporter